MTPVKKRLSSGKPTIGSWLQLPDISVAEIMGQAGYDWVAIDLEHGSFSTQSLPAICMALELGDTLPFVRVAQPVSKDIKQALEAGARGLIFPMISNAEELKKAIDWANYPPYGTRGVGYSRANFFGKNFSEQVPESSKDLVLVAQIEHIQAVQSLDEILVVDRLDAILIGPYDLSASMGLTAQFDHPDFIAVIKGIEEKARRHSIPFGLHIVQPDPDALSRRIEEGHQFIAYGTDAVFLYRSAECPQQKG